MIFNLNRKIDFEAKEQLKIAHLRDQAAKRNMAHLKSVEQADLKEANRLVLLLINKN